jgi:hypothetical protein
MRQARLAFGILFVIAAMMPLLIQGEPAQQTPAGQGQQGQRGGGINFTTNGNGGPADAPLPGQDGGRGGRGQRGPATPPAPAPRDANGRALLTQPPGQPGLWVGGITNLTALDGTPVKIPYQPWAEELSKDRRANAFEPHTRCKPSGGPRQFLTPYGAEFVEFPDAKRMFIFDVGGPHTYREIYMDGREHPKNWTPDYYGHNVGRWEGDTLVIDSTGYNEKFWFDRGILIHTEKMHLIERITRTNMTTMRYEITVDDPGAYTAPWSAMFTLRAMPGDELFEYVCQDNNFAPELMIGVLESVDRTSPIVP